MNDATQMVPVDQLQVGMYVASLDRPWLETPFLFQGFFIRNKSEIEEIQQHCEWVRVSRETLIGQSDLHATGIRPRRSLQAAPVRATGLWQRFLAWLKRLFGVRSDEADDDKYPVTSSLREELKVAIGIRDDAGATIEGVMRRLQQTGDLDVDALQGTVKPVVDSVLRNPAALACLMRIQKKDDYLYSHSLGSSVWATVLGRQIGLDRKDLDVLALGAMLLDVGKVKVPDGLLTKPGPLEGDERKLMAAHIEHGVELLKDATHLDPRIIDMVAYHHERFDGSGYPNKLFGNKIPVFGRIAGIVDAYDAMISKRPYAELRSSYDALRQLHQSSDIEFQAEIVEQFTRAIGAFPTGTLVELSSGEIAVVTKQSRMRRLRPVVMIVTDADKQMRSEFETVNLASRPTSAREEGALWIERGLAPGAYDIDPAQLFLA